MRTYFNILTFLFLTVSVFANEPLVEEIKVIEKSFNVNPNVNLNINNRYGNVTMTTWDKNIIDFRIEIKVDGSSKAAKERLNSITIDFNANASNVSAITQIPEMKGKMNISIHYTVKLPKTANIDIKNRYGNLYLDELNGTSNINLAYGNMTLGKLHNLLNNINLAYMSSAKIDFIKSLNINVDYSKLEINKAEIVKMNADYTDVVMGQVENLINNMDYGNLNVSRVDKMANTADYTNVKIGNLSHSFVSTGDYGAISIKNIGKNFEKIIISSDYTGINLGIDPAAGYSITADLKYGGLKYPSNVNMNKQIEKGSSKYYEGKTANPNGVIELKMSYGAAKITLVN